jgi:hypothetical protein
MSSICESSKESNSAGQSTITVTFFPSYHMYLEITILFLLAVKPKHYRYNTRPRR